MRVFEPAPVRSTARNLAHTLGQALVFWTVFLGLVPWVIARLEREFGLPALSFTHQELVGIGVGLVAAAINLGSGVLFAVVGRGTPFPRQTARELVVVGPYRYLRNPMAFGGLAVGCAIGVYRGSWCTLVYAAIGGVLWHMTARRMEERELSQRFGESYRHYRANVRCWVPRLTPYRGPPKPAEPRPSGAST